MKYFVFQGNESDCGFASLKMLLANLSKDASYLNLPKPEKKSNYTLKDLMDLGNDYGVELKTYKCKKNYLDKMHCPCLAIIRSNHVVMVKKVKRTHVIIYDPGEGILKIRKSKFLKIWDNILLEVIDTKDLKKIGKIRRRILPLKMEIKQIIYSSLSTIVLICAFFFLNNVENYLYSFIFLGLFFITQFIENYLIYKQLNYFDEHYIPLYFNSDEKCTQIEYENFLNFKRNYFVSGRGTLSSILIGFVITFLLCLNDFRNVLALIVLILIKLIDLILNSKQRKESIKEIGKLEKDGLTNSNNTISNLLSANKIASRKVFGQSIKNLLYMIICFLLAICMMVFTSNGGCNFVIFHFVIYFAGFKSYSEMLEYFANKKEHDKKISQFYDNCNL